MKTLKVLFFLLIWLNYTVAAQGQKKYEWSKLEKEGFMESCTESLKSVGVVSEQQGVDICSCALEKLQYVAPLNEVSREDGERAGEECAIEVMSKTNSNSGSQQGNTEPWPDEVRNVFMTNCIEGVGDNPMFDEAKKKKICTCALEKLQAKYTILELSSEEASKYAEKVGIECAQEILGEK